MTTTKKEKISAGIIGLLLALGGYQMGDQINIDNINSSIYYCPQDSVITLNETYNCDSPLEIIKINEKIFKTKKHLCNSNGCVPIYEE